MPENNITQAQDELIANVARLGNAPRMDADKAAEILKALDPAKIIAGSAEKIESAKMESLSNERAAREPLPGPAADIFNNTPLIVKTSIGDVTIRPMVAYDINIFKLINSPFYQIMMGDTPDKAIVNQLFTTEEESYEMIFQFTHSPKICYELFKKGKDAYKDKVMEEISFVYNPADAALLVEKIMEHIFKVNLAKIDFVAPEPEEDKKKQMSAQTTITTS